MRQKACIILDLPDTRRGKVPQILGKININGFTLALEQGDVLYG